MMTQTKPPLWASKYPRCYQLGVAIISTAPGVEHPGFDQDDVAAKLGTTRYNAFMAKLVSDKAYSGSVFSCNHRKYDSGPLKGYEAHGVYSDDLERFLASGG
jgi:hypothetical protein